MKTCGDYGGKTSTGKPCRRKAWRDGMCGEHRGEWRAGRKPRDIDPDVVRRLAEIGCTIEEMMAILGCDNELLIHRFRAEVEQGFAKTKASLRRTQLRTALGDADKDVHPNPTMLIWLGKQYLGQADKGELTGRDGGPIEVNVADARAELERKIDEIRQRRGDD